MAETSEALSGETRVTPDTPRVPSDTLVMLRSFAAKHPFQLHEYRGMPWRIADGGLRFADRA